MSKRQSLLYLNTANKHDVSKLLRHQHIVALKATEACSCPAQNAGSCIKYCHHMHFILYDKRFIAGPAKPIAFCPSAKCTLPVMSCSSVTPVENTSSQQV